MVHPTRRCQTARLHAKLSLAAPALRHQCHEHTVRCGTMMRAQAEARMVWLSTSMLTMCPTFRRLRDALVETVSTCLRHRPSALPIRRHNRQRRCHLPAHLHHRAAHLCTYSVRSDLSRSREMAYSPCIGLASVCLFWCLRALAVH
jgi:hypothetical protein